MNTDNLFLIGYRCTGKSSVGNLLAAALSRTFVDTDSLTSTDSISEIEETLAKRIPLYKNAMDFLVDTDHREIDEICGVIMKNLKAMD